jgi:hypothetical protein
MDKPENPKKSRERMPKSWRVGKKSKLLYMRKIKMFVAVFSAAALMSSCSLTLPVAATSNPVGKKVGSATATGYLGYLFFGADASIRTAAKNGGITKISTVDVKQGSFLGLIVTYETIVTGE